MTGRGAQLVEAVRESDSCCGILSQANTDWKIVKVGTTDELVAMGETGELCLRGEAALLGCTLHSWDALLTRVTVWLVRKIARRNSFFFVFVLPSVVI